MMIGEMLRGRIGKILYTATFPIIIVFVLSMAFGYYFIFVTYDPRAAKIAVGSFAFGFAALVCSAVLHFGGTLADWFDQRGRPNLIVALGTFLVTFIVSGYGVLTALMLLFEGPVILRENLATVRTALLRIEETAAARLRVPEFEAVRARVSAQQQRLMSEINNPVQCGVGPNAMEAITEIQKDLPSVKVLAGTTIKNCARTNLDRVTSAYAELIAGALKQHPLYQLARGGERADLLRQIRDVVAQDKQTIDAALIRLGAITSFVLKLDIFYDTLTVLTRAQSDYVLMYQRLAGLVGPAGMRDVPERIEVTPVEQLPSFFQMLGTFADRIGRTWIYGVIAVLADVVVASVVAHAVLVHRARDVLRVSEHTASDLKIAGVTYIWSPVRTRSAPRDP